MEELINFGKLFLFVFGMYLHVFEIQEKLSGLTLTKFNQVLSVGF